MGFTSFRIGHLHKPRHVAPRAVAPNPSCATGGFYTAPANGATIDSLKPLDIAWDATCLDTQKADIHLLAPSVNGDNTELAVWPNIPFADGKHTLAIKPKWWNATSSIHVQLTIVPAGTPPSLTTLPAGPIFTATYTPPADGSVPASADLTKPDSASNTTNAMSGAGTTKSLSGGKTAAAVLLPLLCVALALFAYFRHQRRKASAKSRRFSQAIDKRMSTISTDWKSMSTAGAHAAIRSSIAVNRDSSAFAFGAIRPLSTEMSGEGPQQMTQVRTGTGVGLRNPGTAVSFAAERASRVSRVSFADSARPSGETTRRTRAFHSAYVPPLPAVSRQDVVSRGSVYPDSELEKDLGVKVVKEKKTGGSPAMSPRQATGPLTLTPEDIRARIHGNGNGRGSVGGGEKEQDQQEEYDEVMPALSMMRTGLEPTTPSGTTTFTLPAQPAPSDEYLFTPLPTPPAPAHSHSPTHAHPYAYPNSPPAYSPTGASYASPSPGSMSGSMSIHTGPATNSPFTPGVYAYTPSSPSHTHTQAPTPATAAPTLALSPDDMLRAYAERKASGSPAPPSAYSPVSSSPKVKGRKLSLRASFGIGSKGRGGGERAQSPAGGVDKAVIGYPIGAKAGAGMAGVGTGAQAGMAGVGARGMGGAQYAIGEDEQEDYESAYVM